MKKVDVEFRLLFRRASFLRFLDLSIFGRRFRIKSTIFTVASFRHIHGIDPRFVHVCHQYLQPDFERIQSL